MSIAALEVERAPVCQVNQHDEQVAHRDILPTSPKITSVISPRTVGPISNSPPTGRSGASYTTSALPDCRSCWRPRRRSSPTNLNPLRSMHWTDGTSTPTDGVEDDRSVRGLAS